MSTPRQQCYAAVLPDEKLIVIGGETSITDGVEIKLIYLFFFVVICTYSVTVQLLKINVNDNLQRSSSGSFLVIYLSAIFTVISIDIHLYHIPRHGSDKHDDYDNGLQ